MKQLLYIHFIKIFNSYVHLYVYILVIYQLKIKNLFSSIVWQLSRYQNNFSSSSWLDKIVKFKQNFQKYVLIIYTVMKYSI